ncbi:hypothetical protein ACNKHM_21190 [Shigella sonnei]
MWSISSRVFRNPHPLLVVAGQDFGGACTLLRPQLQQLPLAVIDEVIVRAGDYRHWDASFLADWLCR